MEKLTLDELTQIFWQIDALEKGIALLENLPELAPHEMEQLLLLKLELSSERRELNRACVVATVLQRASA